jgi:quercetin dioxygenase-like cupin family protein
MNQNQEPVEKQAQYIVVDDIEYQLSDGYTKTFRKHLLTTENLEINQTMIKGSGDAEDYGVSGINRIEYILNGTATLSQEGINTEVGQGHLIIVPPGVPWGTQLSVHSDEFILLDIARRIDNRSAVTSSGTEVANLIRIVKPEDVTSYEPAGHAKTTNRCLFIDEHMEFIEGLIESGGGAERHFHNNNEQMLYVLEGSATPLLIYYPKGAPHGTGGGTSELLKLLVIYSPPLGESQNALA